MEKVIFLDIDGVLTSVRTGWYNFDIYATNYLRWVCEKSGAKIVISSTWRYNHGKEFWKEIFGDFLHDDFKTPDLKRHKNGNDIIRGDEIKDWLDRHPEISKYIILDDDADMLEEQMPNLLQTDSMNGILDVQMMEIKDRFEIKEFLRFNSEIFIHPLMFNHSRREVKFWTKEEVEANRSTAYKYII